MAVRNVSNIREFIAAIEQCQANDVIEVLADLDWNEVVDNITATIKLSGGSTVSNVTINGNNHAIYNLTGGRISTSGSGVNIFQFGTSSVLASNITINNLSFLNCNMGSRTTHIIINSSGGSTTIYNAVIQGKFKSAMFQGSNVIVKDSMITCSLNPNARPLTTGSASSTPKWQYCWIKLDRITWSYSSGQHFATNLTGCYVEGIVGIESAPNNPSMFINVDDSCINVSTFIQQPTTDTFCSHSGDSVNIINIDKITSPTQYQLTEDDSTTWNKCVTDEHMKNAEYLAEIGFNIIP